MFHRRLLCSDNIVLCTLAGLIRFEMLLSMILRVYIFPQQQLRMQFGHHLYIAYCYVLGNIAFCVFPLNVRF